MSLINNDSLGFSAFGLGLALAAPKVLNIPNYSSPLFIVSVSLPLLFGLAGSYLHNRKQNRANLRQLFIEDYIEKNSADFPQLTNRKKFADTIELWPVCRYK